MQEVYACSPCFNHKVLILLGSAFHPPASKYTNTNHYLVTVRTLVRRNKREASKITRKGGGAIIRNQFQYA